MQEKLLQLIYNYSINGKLVDRSYIEQVINIYVSTQEIDDYVLDVQFIQKIICDKGSNLTAILYNPDKKIIRVYNDNCDRVLKSKSRDYIFLEDAEKIFYRNINITQVLLEELEMVSQTSILASDSMESKLLNLNYKALRNGPQYSYSPRQMRNIVKIDMDISKRLSQLKSYKKIIEIVNQLDDVIPNITILREIDYINNMINGYSDANGIIVSPTIQYLKEYGLENELLRFDWYSDAYIKLLNKCMLMYSLDERLLYGLPIDKDEYYHIKDDMQKKLQKLSKNT